MVNICYTGDEGYTMQIAASMTSILENNPGIKMRFFILGDNYSSKTCNRFQKIQQDYRQEISIIDITDQMKLLEDTAFYQKPDIGRNGLITFMFARLFVDSALPKDVDKILYIDGDTIILGNIQELFDTRLKKGCIVGAIRDIWPNSYNPSIGFEIYDIYFMSGLLLIDLILWRSCHIERTIMEHMHKVKQKYLMHDEDVINICLKGKIDTLPLKWGMTYIIREYSPEQILWFCGKTEEEFYTSEEIIEAKKEMALIHYSGDYYGRPWIFPQACQESRIWFRYYNMTPWKEERLKASFNPKQRLVFIAKKVLEKPIKNYWLKRTKKRFRDLFGK